MVPLMVLPLVSENLSVLPMVPLSVILMVPEKHNEVGESAQSSHFLVAGNELSRTSLEEEVMCTYDEDDNHSNTIVVDDVVGNTTADHDTSISVPAYSSIRFDTPKSTTITKRYNNTNDFDREASSLSDDVPFAAASTSVSSSYFEY